jgi:hypothetical protein
MHFIQRDCVVLYHVLDLVLYSRTVRYYTAPMRLSGELGISRVMKVARIMQRSLHSRSLLFWVRGRKCFQPR